MYRIRVRDGDLISHGPRGRRETSLPARPCRPRLSKRDSAAPPVRPEAFSRPGGGRWEHLRMNDVAHPSLQCSTGPFWTYELERAFDFIAEAGFREVELMVTRDPRTQTPDTPLRLARERGLEIKSVHGPFLVVTKTVWGQDPLQKIRRGIETCRAFGATNLIVHPPYLWEREYARWIRAEAAATPETTGVAVSVETMYPVWMAGRQLRAYRWLKPVDLVDAASHVAMDTSHLAVSRYDILDAYRLLAPKLTHIHLSDNAVDGRDGHLELEQGKLPLDRLLAELGKTNYAGAISLEISVQRYLENQDAIVPMLRRARSWIQDRLSQPLRMGKGLPRPQ